MNVNDIFPSRFLKAHDLAGKPYTLTIKAVTLEDLGHGAEKETKLAIAFEKATKMMLLNRTNAMIIASLYGPETDQWLGKAVTVYSARVKAFGAWHDALRIKEQIPARNVTPERMTEAMQEQPPIDDENDLLDVDEADSLDITLDPETGEIRSADESLWEPNAPVTAKPNRLSPAQMARIHILGADVHGKRWDAERPALVSEVSGGAYTSCKELTPDEATLLIRQLEAELKHAQRAPRNGVAA
jgi:hypothetical protein